MHNNSSSTIPICGNAGALRSTFQAGDRYCIAPVGLYHNRRVVEKMVFRKVGTQGLKRSVFSY